MGRVVVAWEGRETLDGRMIAPEALVPKDPRLPIFYNFSYTTPLGWAEEFGRRLNPDTGWYEISFELYFKEDWESKLRASKLSPTISHTAVVDRHTPYEKPEQIGEAHETVTYGEILCVSFGVTINAWGEAAPW